MNSTITLALLWVIASGSGPGPDANQSKQDRARLKIVQSILKTTPLVDGHNDIAEQYHDRVNNHVDQIDLLKGTTSLDPPFHTDIDRLRLGGVGGQFWSVWTDVKYSGELAIKHVYQQIDVIHRMVDRYSDDFEMAYTADDIVRIHKRGKIASLIGLEGGHAIDNSLAMIREYYRSGARYMTLTHARNTDWADAGTDEPEHHGLTAFGELVIGEMNRVGMLVDLSHTSPETMSDVLNIAKAPVIFSHSSARGVVDHRRNVPDSILVRLKDNGGVVMVNYVAGFVSQALFEYYRVNDIEVARLELLHGENVEQFSVAIKEWEATHSKPRATMNDVLDHIDRIKRVAGINHVGLGADFDGTSNLPIGLEDVSTYPALLVEMMKRGYNEKDLRKFVGENVLRVMRETEKVSADLKKSTAISDAHIYEVDRIGDQK